MRFALAVAHADGLAIAQKNTAELGRRGPALGFDFAIAEECAVYRECGRYIRPYGGRVYEIEYRRRSFRAACRAHGASISILLRDREVVARGRPGYVSESC